MTAVLAAGAAIAVLGAVVALAARDARVGLLGLLASMVGAMFIADPLPTAAIAWVRLSGAVLTVAILRAAIATGRAGPAERGWTGRIHRVAPAGLGPVVLALLGAAGAVIGLAIGTSISGVAGTAVTRLVDLATAPTLALGAAGAALAIAIGPALLGPTSARRAMAGVLVVEAVELVSTGLGSSPGVLGEIGFATVLIAVAAGGAAAAAVGTAAGLSESAGVTAEEPATAS